MLKYIDELTDPRWQKQRLEIFQRDDWTCQNCGCTTEPLHIHHFYYMSGKKPWEYLESCLITLCEFCHDLISRNKDNSYVGTPLESKYIRAIALFAINQCDTCYHFQEFKHCSCRLFCEAYKAKSDGSCNDWKAI